MASLGHVIFGAAIARAHGARRLPATVAFAGLAMLPDADVVAFALGIPYADPFGHRGASHSLVGAALGALVLGPVVARALGAPLLRTLACAFVALASHGLFDMLTDGGKGVALWWPLSNERLFFPFTPIPVAPIGVRFLSWRGVVCAATELVLFAPFLIYALSTPKRGAPAAAPPSPDRRSPASAPAASRAR
jgi:inner membrane protein